MANKIVLTGGCGFIGSHTCVELQNAGYDVVIFDNLSNSEASVVDGIERITGKRPAFYQIDCTNKGDVYQAFQKEGPIAGVIHFAASKAVGESVQKPLLYYRNNLSSLMNMMEAAEDFHLKGFVFSSSCTVYGEPDQSPVDENAPIKPADRPIPASPFAAAPAVASVIPSKNKRCFCSPVSAPTSPFLKNAKATRY